jgi:hypothetical protein
VACGPSESDKKRTAAVTCAQVEETRYFESEKRVRLINEARDEIGAEPFLAGDQAIQTAVYLGLCPELVRGDYIYKAAVEKQQAEVEARKRAEQLAEIEDAIDAMTSANSWARKNTKPDCNEIVGPEYFESVPEAELLRERITSLTLKLEKAQDQAIAEAKAEYISNRIELGQSLGGTIFRLNWRNTGQLAVISVDVSVAIDGKPLFDADKYEYLNWRFYGGGHFAFDSQSRKTKYGETIKGLGPGESYEMMQEFDWRNLGGDQLRELEDLGFKQSQLSNARVVIVDAKLTSNIVREKRGRSSVFLDEPTRKTFSEAIEGLVPELHIQQDRLAELQKNIDPKKETYDECIGLVALYEERDELNK